MHKLLAAIFQILPHHFISRLILHISRIKTPWFKQLLINNYVKIFKIDLQDAVDSSPHDYPSLNAFFTRALKPSARPLAAGDGLISPVDGTISQIGRIENDQLLQAKGKNYSLDTLLGGMIELTPAFSQGHFATIYLSPRDYHRIHMPIDGVLTNMIHVPGRLFSVSPFSVNHVDSLFARNERVVCLFDTAAGRLAVILVGAINVAAIETSWAGLVTPPRGKAIQHTPYDEKLVLKRGMEMGRFNMGSTVIILTQQTAAPWLEELMADATLRMGQAMT